MSRGRVSLLFVLCAGALLGVMAWLTSVVWRLEGEQRQSREQAVLEESVRLALWRMESLLAPLVAQENSRPYYLYRAFYPARFAPVIASTPTGQSTLQIASPLATDGSPHVWLHFQWDAAGRLTSPRLPPEPWRNREDGARQGYEEARSRLQALAQMTDGDSLRARLEDEWLVIERPPGEGDTRAGSTPTGGTESRPVATSAIEGVTLRESTRGACPARQGWRPTPGMTGNSAAGETSKESPSRTP